MYNISCQNYTGVLLVVVNRTKMDLFVFLTFQITTLAKTVHMYDIWIIPAS